VNPLLSLTRACSLDSTRLSFLSKARVGEGRQYSLITHTITLVLLLGPVRSLLLILYLLMFSRNRPRTQCYLRALYQYLFVFNCPSPSLSPISNLLLSRVVVLSSTAEPASASVPSYQSEDVVDKLGHMACGSCETRERHYSPSITNIFILR